MAGTGKRRRSLVKKLRWLARVNAGGFVCLFVVFFPSRVEDKESGEAKGGLISGPDRQPCGSWKINFHMTHQESVLRGESQASVRKPKQTMVLSCTIQALGRSDIKVGLKTAQEGRL